MPNRSRKPKAKPETDINTIAYRIVHQSTKEPAKEIQVPVTIKNQAAVELGRLGGLKGGKARAAKLSPKTRKQIAQKAAQARWANRSKSGHID